MKPDSKRNTPNFTALRHWKNRNKEKKIKIMNAQDRRMGNSETDRSSQNNAFHRTIRSLSKLDEELCKDEDEIITLSTNPDGSGELLYTGKGITKTPLFKFSRIEELQLFLDGTQLQRLLMVGAVV